MKAMSINDLDLTVRTYNVLRREGVLTLRGIADCTEDSLWAMRGMTAQSVDEIKGKLAEHGHSLALLPLDEAVRHETVHVYRSGTLTLTVQPDGHAEISKLVLNPVELCALGRIMAAVTADTTAEEEKAL